MYLLLKSAILNISLLWGLSVLAQKQVSKTYDAHDVSSIAIDSDDIFKIEIQTEKTDKITLTTQIDGESYESTLLNTAIVDHSLHITTGKTPDFIPFNDKLSAHKVLSIVLKISIPEGIDLYINSALAALQIAGSIGNLQCNLGRGGCELTDIRFRESINITTISGNIYIKTPSAQIEAQSRNGKVAIPQDLVGNKSITLETIYGDILVHKSL